MNKIGQVFIVIGLVAACYLILLVVMPVLNQFASSANATIQSSVNVTLFPGAVEVLLAAPWVLWFVPASIGMIAVVLIMRRP